MIKNENGELLFNKFGNIYKDYPTFKSEIIDQVIAITGNKEYVDETKMYFDWQALYKIFLNAKSQRWMRYQKSEFEGYFINKMIELLPTLFIKQRTLILDQFDTLKDLQENGKLPSSILYGVRSSDSFNGKGVKWDEAEDNVDQRQASKQEATDENLLRASERLMGSQITNEVTLFCNEFDELFVSLSTEQLKSIMGEDYYKQATLYDVLKTIITGDDVHFNDQNEIITITTNTFIKNMNVNPQDNPILLKGTGGVTYDLQVLVDDLKSVRDQADIIGLNVVEDELGNLIQLDDDSKGARTLLTKKATELLIKNSDGAIKDLSHLKTQDEIYNAVEIGILYLMETGELVRPYQKSATSVSMSALVFLGGGQIGSYFFRADKDNQGTLTKVVLQPTTDNELTNKKYVDDKFKTLLVNTGTLSRANGLITDAYKRGDIVTYISDSLTGTLAYDDTNIKYIVSGTDIVDEALNANTYIQIGQLYK